MRKWMLLPLLALLGMAGGAAWRFREPLMKWTREVRSAVVPKPKPDPQRYAVLVSELQRWRADLAKKLKQARTPAETAAVEHDARILLEATLPELMRCWLGTPWDFNGTAAKPGGGKIACGYFVSTVLMDAGFKVDRYQLARQASGNIMRSFLEKDDCRLTVDQPYEQFADGVSKAEPGIYLLGLDTHVGFLVVTADGFRMLHSSGCEPWCVVDESRENAWALKRSSWRMIGNLTADKRVIRRWLKAEKIAVAGA